MTPVAYRFRRDLEPRQCVPGLTCTRFMAFGHHPQIMGEDASLDDFLDGRSGVEEGEPAEAEAVGEAEEEEAEVEVEAEAEVEAKAEGKTEVEADVEVEAGGVGGVAPGGDGAAPTPERPTSSWRPDSRCDACGESARRRWRQGERLVCAACAHWE